MSRFLLPVLIVLLVLGALVNLIGAFGPEMGFDALWYHLTLPKLYLQAGEIYPVSGGLLYYSTVPRFTEIIYMLLIPVSGYIGPHLVQWLAGVLAGVVTYKIAKEYVSKQLAVLAAAIFYLTPLVGWQSGSAYVDLVRTLFESLAFLFFIKKKPIWSGVSLGLALSTKMLALGTMPIFVVLFMWQKNWKGLIKFIGVSSWVAAPWYVYNFMMRGNPIYPIAGGVLDSNHTALPQLLNFSSLATDFWKVFMRPEDLITPVYVLVLPIIILTFKKIWQKHPELLIFVVLSYLVWWLIPRLGGGRYLLPYLPVWATLVVVTLSLVKEKVIQYSFIVAIVLVCLLNLVYRVGATARLLPVVFGGESVTSYLCRNISSMPGTFVDCDSWFANNIENGELVYVQGVHNLFYLNFPFVHETWYQGEKIDYILIQGDGQPAFSGELVNEDPVTNSRVYKL